MPRVQPIRIHSGNRSSITRNTSRRWCREERIHFYGWDSRAEIWHGPTDIGGCDPPDKRLIEALRTAPGRSWYGPIQCCTSSEPSTRFFALVHDLSDCAIASIYCDESKAGPAEILAVLPHDRRPRLREDFAFEFLAYARFLGSLSAAAELQVHEAIAAAIASEPNSAVFSMSSGLLPDDLDPVLSCCAEKLAVAMCGWLAEAERERG